MRTLQLFALALLPMAASADQFENVLGSLTYCGVVELLEPPCDIKPAPNTPPNAANISAMNSELAALVASGFGEVIGAGILEVDIQFSNAAGDIFGQFNIDGYPWGMVLYRPAQPLEYAFPDLASDGAGYVAMDAYGNIQGYLGDNEQFEFLQSVPEPGSIVFLATVLILFGAIGLGLPFNWAKAPHMARI